MEAGTDYERTLVAKLREGDEAARAEFFQRTKDVTWRACLTVAGGNSDPRKLYAEVCNRLEADNFARLQDFDARSPLTKFVGFVVREVLSARVLELLHEAPPKGWAFEHFFADDIAQEAKRFFRARVRTIGETHLELICEKINKHFARDNYHNVRLYRGDGPFAHFILTAVRNKLRDIYRRVRPRVRPPKAIKRLSTLDQLVWEQVYKYRIPADPKILLPKLVTHAHTIAKSKKTSAARKNEIAEAIAQTSKGDIVAAIARVGKALEQAPKRRPKPPIRITSLFGNESVSGKSDEERQIDEETRRAIRMAFSNLSPTERQCLILRLMTNKSAAETASTMGLTKQTIYQLTAKGTKKLRTSLSDLKREMGRSVRRNDPRDDRPPSTLH